MSDYGGATVITVHIWVYALHSNTHTMAFWIVVTSKLCNFTHNNEVLISLH